MNIVFNAWLQSLPRQGDFVQISPSRPFAHDETLYDAQYGIVDEQPEEGAGLCTLLREQGVDTSGPALEIGCGTGRLTAGIANAYPGPAFVVTDPSPAFLQLTARRLAARPRGPAALHHAILNGDDLAILPEHLFSLIALRSTLHHILDVDAFIAACARCLAPGGALAMSAEPVESGYVLMGAVAQAIAPAFTAAGTPLTEEQSRHVQLFTDTMKFYCRRDLDKSAAEDKHLFRVHELTDIGARHGLQLRYFANAQYADFAAGSGVVKNGVRFSVFFTNYLRYCMSFPPEFVELIGKHLRGHLEYIDACYPTHVGPLFTGVFLFVKQPASR